ncbi:MAG: tRNA (guanosine(37)-N1)-methyltransferase TrmD [Chlamydiia bacterium]|nr:tRNA (guanosine(37)-N1)-methyltransferase TrmD [Chlamydiia bacterium]
MIVHILSLFPEYFEGPLNASMLARAQTKGVLTIERTNVRDYATDRYRTVDDRPYGGGPGMVMKPEPLVSAIREARGCMPEGVRPQVIYPSPQGRPLTPELCRELATHEALIFVCGHYEGIDERVVESEVDQEISIGDYVLTNGCLGTIVILDALCRFIPGVLGNDQGANEDSFENGRFDCPHYTRPEEFEGKRVPEVLLGGHHAEIEKWREERAVEKMQRVRPDLYARYKKSQ